MSTSYSPWCPCRVIHTHTHLICVLFIFSLVRIFSDSFSSPCIWTRNSVLIRRAASLSFSFLEPQSESTSSMKMMEGLCWRARSKRFFTSLEKRAGGEGRDEENELMLHCNILPNSDTPRFPLNTYFSLSPSHLDMRSDEETEKKVELLASVATALARYDLPVPGGPNSRIPLHGVRLPENTEKR